MKQKSQLRPFAAAWPGLLVAVLLVGPTACVPSSRDIGPTVGDAMRHREQHSAATRKQSGAPASMAGAPRAGDGEAAIAVVGDVPISRKAVVALLLRSHGVGILEQFIGLEVVAQAAKQQGIGLDEHDVKQECDRALRRLLDPLSPATSPEFDRDEAERILTTVLAERNISRDEFMITIRRNAYLRQILGKQIAPTEEQLRDEFARNFGERAVVRHIQIGSPGDLARVQEALTASESFESVARRFSANSASAARGGLLEPFARNDDDLPAVFRQSAFSLQPGQTSKPVRIGQWEHLIRMEEIIPVGRESFESVRDSLTLRVKERLIERKMPILYEDLLRDAEIKIEDESLRETFYARNPKLRR